MFTKHCTMGLSIALKISKITKRKRARFCSILIETIRSCLGLVKNCPNIQGKYFRQIFIKNVVLIVKNMKGMMVKVEILHRG